LPPPKRKNKNPTSPLKTIPGEDLSFSARKKGMRYRLGFEKLVREQIRGIVFDPIFKKS
jgi:hypothetical protein